MPGHFSHMRLSPISMIASFGAAHVRFSNGDSRFFINAKSYVSMQQAINQAPTNSMGALAATGLAAVLKSTFRIVFGEKVSMAVAVIAVCAMWLHAATTADPVAAEEAVATDCLWLLPWGIAWAVRATVSGSADFSGGRERVSRV